MLSFIKHHWLPYLIGAVLAVALGIGIAYFIGIKGSTQHPIDDQPTNPEIKIESGDLSDSGSEGSS